MAEFFNSYKKGGIPGFSSYLSNPQSLTDKALAAILRKTGVGKSAKLVSEFDADIRSLGIHKASESVLQRLKCNVELIGTLPHELGVEGTPLIVASNHEGWIEPAFIFSILKRPDHLIIGGVENSRMGQAFSEHLLPVKPLKFAGEKSLLYGTMTSEQIKKLNRETLVDAAKKVGSGSSLTIFPAGRRNRITSHWHNGISDIMLKLSEKERSETQFLPIFFQGFEGPQLKELILEMAIWGEARKPKKVTAYIGNPIAVDKVIGNEIHRGAVNANLKKYYLSQFNI